MTTQISTLGRLGVATEGTFNTAELVGAFVDLPVVEGSAQFAGMQAHLEPEVMQQAGPHAYTDSKQVLGVKSSTLAFTTYLAGTGAPQDGNNAWLTTTWALYNFLSAMMGGASQGTAQAGASLVVAAGSTASSINVTAGHGDPATGLARKGGAFACYINGKYEAREILSCTANNVVPKVAFSATPADNAPILWATTFHLISGLSANLSSLQFLCEGAEAADEYTLLGGQGTLAIDIATGAIAKLSASITGASWTRSTLRTLAAPASIPGFGPVPHMDSELILGSGAAGVSFTADACQTRNLIQHSSSTWTPSWTNSPITSPDGLNSSNIVGWKRARSRACTGSFVTYGDDSLNGGSTAWLTADANRYDYGLYQQIGSTASGFVLLSAPTIQITAAPTRTDAGGLYGLTIPWAARNDAAIASATTGLQDSAQRIHLF